MIFVKKSNPLKSQIPGALEAKIALIALYQQTVLVSFQFQLHSVAAFYLKSHIVPGREVGMMIVHGAAVPPGYIRAL